MISEHFIIKMTILTITTQVTPRSLALAANSVTGSGDLLNFGHLFKAFGSNNLPKSPLS